jgi:hypothetical protein
MRMHSYESFIGLGFGYVSYVAPRFRLLDFDQKRVTITL